MTEPMHQMTEPMDQMTEPVDQMAEAMGQTTERKRARSGPFLFGMILIGVGGAAAVAAQTGLTLGQSGSILLLICALAALGFLIFRSSSADNP